MIKIFKYLKKQDWLLVLCSLVFIVLQVWLDLKLPDYMSEITRLVQTEGSRMNDILYSGGMMVLCAMGSLAATFIVGFFVAKIAAGLSKKLREMVYNKTMSFSMEKINGFWNHSLCSDGSR